MTKTPGSLYGVMATAEMVTWSGLIVAMIARYGFGYEGPLFFVAGISHGVIFIAYCITAVVVGMNQRWGLGTIALALIAAIPPYATLPFDRWLVAKDKLSGTWRLEDSGDPRDQRPVDRLLRFWLRHPAWFFVVIVVGMAVVLTVLLLLGSPAEWGNG
jgi:integral membrane protein